jgi:hypothetical protein
VVLAIGGTPTFVMVYLLSPIVLGRIRLFGPFLGICSALNSDSFDSSLSHLGAALNEGGLSVNNIVGSRIRPNTSKSSFLPGATRSYLV